MYKWDKESGVVNEEGQQVCQLFTPTAKFREVLGRLLVMAMNQELEKRGG